MDTSKLDVDALFKQYSIKEVQALDVQIKNEIEKKKEDLRIMVYNRYRDLIDAADGIHVMKSRSKRIETVLNDLLTVSERIFNDKDNSMFADQERQRAIEKAKRINKYVLAVIIKILQNTPTKIWYHLDNNEFLKAAKQYLIAQNAHACIDIEKALKSQENFVSYVQYANDLWKSIALLSSTIIGKARSILLHTRPSSVMTTIGSQMSQLSPFVSSITLIDAIACIYLLESSSTSLRSLFDNYLSTRNKIICSVVDNETLGTIECSFVIERSNVKDRVVESLRTFVYTIRHLYDLFSSPSSTSSSSTNKNGTIESNNSVSYEALISDGSFTIESLKDDGIVLSKIPSYLKSIKFKDVEGVRKLDQEYVSLRCSQWLSTCLDMLKKRIESALKYAVSLKSLSLIKEAVTQFENSLSNNNNNYNQPDWIHVCQTLFNRRLDIWSQLVAPFYYSQSKFIIETSFKTTHENFMRNLTETVHHSKVFDCRTADKMHSTEIDLNSYLWPLDVFNQTNENLTTENTTTPGHQKKQIDFFPSTSGGASRPLTNLRSISSRQLYTTLKQYSTTPSVQKLCKQFDDDLGKLISDIEFGSIDQVASSDNNDNDAAMKSGHLKDNMSSFSENISGSLLEFVNNLSSTMTNKNDDDTMVRIRKILFVCRLAHALPYTCPNLRACFATLNDKPPRMVDSTASPVLNKITKSLKQSIDKNLSDELWSKLMEKIVGVIRKGTKVWIDSLCNELSRTHLSKSTLLIFLCRELTAWDEIEIEDELNMDVGGENPNEISTQTIKTSKVKSKLSVPLVCSPSIQNILYWLSQQLTKNLNYTMIESSLVLKDLVLKVLDLVLNSYRDIYEEAKSRGAGSDNHDNIERPVVNKIVISQNQALQILFDLKFLSTLFDVKTIGMGPGGSPTSHSSQDIEDDDETRKLALKLNEAFKNVTGLYESLVDPFDYDICMPFIQSNVSKCIARTSTLFGVLGRSEKQVYKSVTTLSTASTTTANEKFNLMPLSSIKHRFELLPILSSSSSLSSSSQAANQQASSTNQTHTSQTQASSQKSRKMDEMSKKSFGSSSSTATTTASSGLFKWFKEIQF